MDQQNENRGRDQYVVNQPKKVYFGHPSTISRSLPEQQLLQSVRREIDLRLRQSLHNAILINLNKEIRTEYVKRPWVSEVKTGTRPAEPIPENTSILEVFDRSDIGGKLLILGSPGSGKTTLLLDLARALLVRADDNPELSIPVLFNLSSWQEHNQRICDWLILELKQKHQIRKEIGEVLLRERRLLPLLDGLDEMGSDQQEICVQAINQFFNDENAPLYGAVCSRYEAYITHSSKLLLNGAICLQALTLGQLREYLMEIERFNLWIWLNKDEELLELVKTPLFLSILILAYPQDLFDHWEFTTAHQRREDLWDKYICRMFERELSNCNAKEPDQKQSRRWLVWLAQQMQQASQTELRGTVEPTWLLSSNLWYYRLSSGVIGGLVGGLSSFLIVGSVIGSVNGLIIGLVNGLLSASIGGFTVGVISGVVDSLINGARVQLQSSQEISDLPRKTVMIAGLESIIAATLNIFRISVFDKSINTEFFLPRSFSCQS